MIDLSVGADIASAATVVPEGDAVLGNGFAANGGLVSSSEGLYVTGQTDGISRLFFLANGSHRPIELKLPIQGVATGLFIGAEGNSALLALEDWFTAPRYFAARPSGLKPLGLNSASDSGIAGARAIREMVTSADGTRVPMAILIPAKAQPGHPMPLLLEGYGSYGFSLTQPYYSSQYFGLLEEGGIVAFCGTRGGGERGEAWYQAGRAANKPNAQADFIACGERLVQLGLTRPGMMTAMGSSAGGVLAPPASLKRPDLFRTLIANVAMLNPTRLSADPNGPNQYAEMGDPGTKDGFDALWLSDSYQMLQKIKDIPDILLLTGLNDHRVSPWTSAKFTAAALDRFGDRHLILLRTDPDSGHFSSAKQQTIEQYADMWSFVLNRAGVPGFVDQAK